MEQQRINITIAGKTFPLSVASPEDEEKVRKAAAEINGRLSSYQERYPGKGLGDLLSLVALKLGMEKLSIQEKAEEQSRESAQLNIEIESYLNKIDK